MNFLIISFRVDVKLPTISNVYKISTRTYDTLKQTIANELCDGDSLLMDDFGFICLDDNQFGNTNDCRFGTPQAHSITDLT